MRSRHYKLDDLEKELKTALDEIKNEDARLRPSVALQNRLLNALRFREKTQSHFWIKAAAVFAFSIFCGSIWILKPELRQNSRDKTNNTSISESNYGYMPLTYGLTPEESLQRVRVKLPRSALNDFGISLNQTRSEEVTADVLVGESGLPYAIRVVQQN